MRKLINYELNLFSDNKKYMFLSYFSFGTGLMLFMTGIYEIYLGNNPSLFLALIIGAIMGFGLYFREKAIFKD